VKSGRDGEASTFLAEGGPEKQVHTGHNIKTPFCGRVRFLDQEQLMTIILGINWEQNSTVSLWINQELKGCISEERLSRVKNDERYPKAAIDFLLDEFKLSKESVDKIVYVSTMWSFGYILTRHYTSFTIKDYVDEQHKVWKPRLFENKNISQIDAFRDKLDLQQFPGDGYWNNILLKHANSSGHVSNVNSGGIDDPSFIRKEVANQHLGTDPSNSVFVDHSSSHAAYAYYTSPYCLKKGSTLVLTLDAFGDNVNYSASIFRRSEKGQYSKELVSQGNSFIIGRLYRYITLILGLKPNEHEYKVMGMAPYCKDKYSQKLLDVFKTFQDVDGLHFIYKDKPADMYFTIRSLLEGERFDAICGAVQRYTEYLVTKWVENLVSFTGISEICLAGGVSMNVKANMLIAKTRSVKSIFIPPSPDDSSQAMGCVLEYLSSSGKISSNLNNFTPYLGSFPVGNRKEFLDYQSAQALFGRNYQVKCCDIDCLVTLLSEGMIIARCCGREEFGARALGNRSIIADPRNESVKKKINEKIKNRDFWMPFACSVIDQKAQDYFLLESDIDSYQYMTLCCETTELGAKLLPAALHPYDGTCRPQILRRDINPDYYDLIQKFGERTGVYGLLNTSFNLHGLPIVSNAYDALVVMESSSLDALVIDSLLITRAT